MPVYPQSDPFARTRAAIRTGCCLNCSGLKVPKALPCLRVNLDVIMIRLLLLLLLLILAGALFIAGYALFGDLSPPPGQVVLPLELDAT